MKQGLYKLSSPMETRLSTQKQKYRVVPKRTQTNQLFNNDTTRNSFKSWMNKRTSSCNRKKIIVKNIHQWQETNFVSAFKTPKHSLGQDSKYYT